MCDIGIIIALKEEFREFHEWFRSEITPVQDEETKCHYYEFKRNTEKGAYSCVATLSGEAGETRAGRVAVRMIAKYKPITVVVLGIAAGINEDIRLCDLVVATHVQSFLENSKAISNGKSSFELQLSGKPHETSHVLKDAIDHAEFAKNEQFRKWAADCARDLEKELPNASALIEAKHIRKEPNLLCGPIACGPVVGASPAFVTFLKRHDRKFLALEMESGGILGATHEQPNPSKSLVLRGISDFGDERKSELDNTGNGAFRRVAMRNAIRLYCCAMDMELFPRHPASPTSEIETKPKEPMQGLVSPALLPQLTGCSGNVIALRVESVSDVITSLKDHFAFDWEPGSYRTQPPIVFWPVRLRAPTPIHAAQAFAAAAIQKHGGEVILCLDDLGSREHTPEDFFATVRRWCKRIHVDAQFEERRFSDIIGGNSSTDAWQIVQKWLGFTEQRLLEVLRISKILKAEDGDALSLNILASRRPRRLLTPAMIWTFGFIRIASFLGASENA